MKKLILILLCCLAFFSLLNLTPGIPGGDDGYRHVKFAQLIYTDWQTAKTEGWHIVFHWPKPVDAWFLFHLLLGPLALAFYPIIAYKIFSTVIFGFIIFLFLQLLKAMRARYHVFWLAVLLLGNAFLLNRMALGRPFLLSVLFCLAGTWFIFKSKTIWFGVMSALHALAHSIFFIILIVPVVNFLLARTRKNFYYILYGILGVALGVAVNPFFPQNLLFSLDQSYSPLFVGAPLLSIGSEVYPVSLTGLVSLNLALAGWLLATIIFLIQFKKYRDDQPLFFVFCVSWLFFLLGLKTQRGLDYFLPFAVLFSAALFTPFMEKIPWPQILKKITTDSMVYGPLATATLMFVAFFGANLAGSMSFIKKAPSPFLYYGASQYLLGNSQKNALVFNTQWGQYQQLYFWNSKNYYVAGIDITIFYLRDQKKYWLWSHVADDELLTCTEKACNKPKETRTIYQAVKNDFGATFLFVENSRNPNLKRYLDKNKDFRKVYADEKTSLYKIL
jgi:hypothetical protein